MRRPFWIRVAVTSLFAVPVGLLALLAVLLGAGGRPPHGVIAPLAILSAVCAVVAGLLLWSRLWSGRFLIPAVVVCVLLALITAGISVEFGLTHPESFFDFVTSLVTVLGPLIAAAACVAAIAARRKRTLRDGPRRTVRRAVLAVPATVVALGVVSGIATFAGGPAHVRAGDAVEVDTFNDRFHPEAFIVTEGERVEFLVRNADSYAHTFSIDELEVDEYIAPHAQRLVRFTVPRPDPGAAEVTLYCAIIGHEGMTGTIRVEEARA